MFVVRDTEAQRVLGALDQHQSGALEQTVNTVSGSRRRRESSTDGTDQ